MRFWFSLAGGLLRQVVKPELDAIAKNVGDAIRQATQAYEHAGAAISAVKELRQQMSACIAIDVGFKEGGKVILLSRVQGQDRVRIVNVKPELTLLEYKRLIDTLERDYGARPTWIDGPPGIPEILAR